MIDIIKDNDEIISININGEQLDSDDGEKWITPKALLKNNKICDLPEDIEFELCEKIQDGMIILDSIPTKIKKLAPNKILLSFEDSGTRKYWDGSIGFSLYMETKKSIVEERARELNDIKFDSYDDDGAYIFLLYSAEIECETCDEAIIIAEQIINEIDGAAELRIGAEIFKISATDNEKDFTLRIVLPIIRKLGFQNVKYNHGKREYGKDVVFARLTEFDEIEHWAAQIKYGDVNGGTNSEIDELISQAEDAFKMPYYDLYTKSKVRPSKVCIIISGKFTENAIEKICEKIESHALKNNLIFIDGDKIKTLSERFTRRL